MWILRDVEARLNRFANLDFVRNVIGKSRVTSGGVVSRTPNNVPLPNGFRALPVTELG
jgi:hypothetical protein